MKSPIKQILSATIALGIAIQPAQAALLTLATQPIYLGAAIPPVVMLNVGRDHQLHYKAYTDYSDLDGDGVLDTTYKHSITYYGYFDSFKCYNYSTTNNRFEPFGTTTDKYCTGANAGKWSGNFLNWVSMTRIDAVRKLLYGGLRSTDTATVTVLERSYLPPEAHSFAKYYEGKDESGADDFHKLTPFTSANVRTSTNATTSTDSETIPGLGPTVTRTFTVAAIGNLAPLVIGDAIKATSIASPANYMIGRVTVISGSNVTIEVDGNTGSFPPVAAGPFVSWRVENLSQVGISFCNVTMGATSGANQLSHTNTNPPLLKVARGNFSLWSSMERYQCHWDEEISSPDKGAAFTNTRWNGNVPSASGINSNAGEPSTGLHLLGGTNFIVRVQACVASLIGTEKCKEYNTNNAFKPIGLVQTYGEPGLLRFGLMTGSYAKNVSGGVLRKNPGALTDEIAADGTFLAAPAAGHIIHSLNRLRLYGYDYSTGEYNNDGCGIFTATGGSASASRSVFAQGNCSTWGNPMSEIYLESLRYFAGASAQSAFTYTSSGSKDAALGLPLATWNNGSTFLSNSNYCTPLNVLNFNAAVASFDRDQFAGTAALAGTPDAISKTNDVGGHEGINGRNWLVGKLYTGGNQTATTAADFEVCTEKPVDFLGHVAGICSEAPAIEGSYLMAGLAHYAKTNRIRTDLGAVPANDTKSLKVTTYGITLSSNIPQIRFRNPSDPTQTLAVLLPSYRPQDTSNPAGFGAGGLVDFKVVPGSLVPATGATAGIEKGRYYVNWEVSQHGADYDSDAWGVVSYCVKTASNSCGSVTPTSETVGNITITTDLVFTAASGAHGFGYVISGTNQDGAHYHSGDTNFNYSYQPGTGPAVAECVNCNRVAGGTSKTYTPTSGTSFVLQDPLYYAAKNGGFKDSDANDIPNLTTEWDTLRADGSPGSDGNPDNYFLVSNPLGLENALNKVFLTILQTSSASSVATNSTSLQAGTKLYQARFNSNDWSGQVLAFPVASDGSVATTPEWDAGELMNPALTPSFNPNTRVIMTYTKGVSGSAPRGVPFRWPSNAASPTTSEMTAAMVAALNTNPSSGATDSQGSARVDYLRGVATREGTATGDFRRRQISKLGDIVNSNPNFVGVPTAGHGDSAYASFRLTHLSRTPIVYAGANDGMVHGFNASNDPATRGREVFAYMPSKSVLKANKLTNQNYQHEYFVDGSPEVQDVCTTAHAASDTCTAWATYLAGTLGAGGHAVYMLDVTNPANFTEANAANIVKWEFTDADDPDLGNSMGTPLIRRMANGKWAVIVSGGYNNSASDGAASTTGHGVIFILFASGPTGPNGTWVSGTDYLKLTTATGSVATPNGLAQPFSADINTDGIIDFLYAGDLLGNFWKFDVRSTTAGTWAAANSRVVLFQARDAANNVQPITAAAEGSSHVTGEGFMINFGTGKYLENTDVTPPGAAYLTQSYYGIWDKNDNATISLQTTVARSELLQQQVLVNVTTTAGTARVLSNNQPNWTNSASPPLHKGWYLDFPASTPPALAPTTGERAVFQPTLINGRLIFTTLVPSTATCSSGGQSFLMVLDNMTGGRFNASPFDTTGDGTINSSDLVTVAGQSVAVSGLATGIGSTGGIAGTPTVIKAGTGAGGSVSSGTPQYAGGTSGLVAAMGVSSYWEAYLSLSTANVANVLLDLGSNSLGRLSWREITAD